MAVGPVKQVLCRSSAPSAVPALPDPAVCDSGRSASARSWATWGRGCSGGQAPWPENSGREARKGIVAPRFFQRAPSPPLPHNCRPDEFTRPPPRRRPADRRRVLLEPRRPAHQGRRLGQQIGSCVNYRQSAAIMSDRGSAVRWLSRVRTCPLRPVRAAMTCIRPGDCAVCQESIRDPFASTLFDELRLASLLAPPCGHDLRP